MWEDFFAFDDLTQVSVYIKLTAIIIIIIMLKVSGKNFPPAK